MTDLQATRHDLVRAARMIAGAGNSDDALGLVQRFLREMPELAEDTAEIFLDIGGRAAARIAIEHLETRLAGQPRNLATLVLLHRAFTELGDPEELERVEVLLENLRRQMS